MFRGTLRSSGREAAILKKIRNWMAKSGRAFNLTLEWGWRCCWTVAGNPALVFGVAMPMLMRLPPSLFGTTKALGISKAFVFIPWTYLTSCRSVTLQLSLNYVACKTKFSMQTTFRYTPTPNCAMPKIKQTSFTHYFSWHDLIPTDTRL